MEQLTTVLTKASLDDTALRQALKRPITGRLRVWVTRLSEPHTLFPVLTIMVLSIIWGTTFNLIKVERANAMAASAAAALELVNTYEAQVVRALREIDQTLKLVKYVYELTGASAALLDLKNRTLLPPDLLFVVRVVDVYRAVVASSRPAEARS